MPRKHTVPEASWKLKMSTETKESEISQLF